MSQTLADGQVAAGTPAAIFTNSSSGASIVDVAFSNTGGSTETLVTQVLRGAGSGTARRLRRDVLATNEQVFIQGIPLAPGDVLNAGTTDASVVDFTVFAGTGELRATAFDANGSAKSVSSGISGNQTISGQLTVKSIDESPSPLDTYAATMTIDVTYGFHLIAAANGTSATVTFTPSAAGSEGQRLTIVTETDSSGTVTATFASTFHSSGTQATTSSKFSSIEFVSDGTRWVEKCRTTALS